MYIYTYIYYIYIYIYLHIYIYINNMMCIYYTMPHMNDFPNGNSNGYEVQIPHVEPFWTKKSLSTSKSLGRLETQRCRLLSVDFALNSLKGKAACRITNWWRDLKGLQRTNRPMACFLRPFKCRYIYPRRHAGTNSDSPHATAKECQRVSW